MKRKGIYYILIIMSSMNGCSNFGDSHQVYPKLKWDSIKSIRITGDFEKIINDEQIFNEAESIFADSLNFFHGEMIQPNKNKKQMAIELIAAHDTLGLWVYPTEINGKYEMGFLDSYDPSQPNKFRKFNRFYMNDKFVQLLTETRD